jgi:hypothetical protein
MPDSKSSTSKKEIEELTMALGAALAQWGVVESNLFLLYAVLCRGGEFPNTHSIIYEALVHTDSKLAVIDALVEFRIKDQKLLGQWTTLHNRIRRRIKNVRNKLAHWRIYSSDQSTEHSAFLAAPIYRQSTKVKGFGRSDSGAMSAKDLWRHAASFNELKDEIRGFILAYEPKAFGNLSDRRANLANR